MQIDIHIMTQPPSGEWVYFDTELTNSSGRVSYALPESKRLGIGVYPVKMVVRYAEPLMLYMFQILATKNSGAFWVKGVTTREKDLINSPLSIYLTCASSPYTITFLSPSFSR